MAVEQNGFLNIGDGAIKGNATVSGYEDQIVVQSVSYGVSQAGEWEEGEQITGRVTMFGDLNVTKVMDNGSPALAHACAMKTQFDNAVLNLVAGTDAYLTVTCEKVIVTSVQVGYSTGDTRPTENITLSYRKATWRYGTATTSYNLEAATD
jgi:type VI secretion system secreted protein Hcp